MTTPTSSPAPMKTPAHSVAMPTPLLQAVYDRNSQQPLYILQSGNTPTLIPVQGIQMAQPTQRGGHAPTTLTSSITIPTSLNLDHLSGKGGMATLHTPPPGTPKTLNLAQTFGGGSLDGLMQPSPLLLPQTNGGMQLSESGPIRSIVRQAAKERPSPVAMDGEFFGVLYILVGVGFTVSCIFLLLLICLPESQEQLRKAIPKYANIDQRPPFTYASLIRQVSTHTNIDTFTCTHVPIHAHTSSGINGWLYCYYHALFVEILPSIHFNTGY